MIMGPWIVNWGSWNVITGPCNVIMGPWNLNRELWYVIMGPVM
jgi:hypothetical protein